MERLTAQRTIGCPEPQITNGRELLELARGWLKQGNPIVAAELLKSASVSSEADQDRNLHAQILKETGRARMMQSDWGNAESLYTAAQRAFLDLEHYRGAAECARNRANMAFQQGNYAHTEQLCDQALGWASLVGEHELRATILNTLGAVRATTGDKAGALKQFELCLADFRAAGNQIRQGYTLLNIGLTATDIKDYGRAVESLNEALRIAFAERDLQLVEICFQNIARCHLAQNDFVLAKSVCETARKILPALHAAALEVELDVLEARILRQMGDLTSAERILESSLRRAIEQNLSQLHADILLEQGLLSKQRGDRQLAIYKLDSAAAMFRKIGADQAFRETVQELDNLYSAAKLSASA
jgi:tetratricopeptide (TPR) repeat protein